MRRVSLYILFGALFFSHSDTHLTRFRPHLWLARMRGTRRERFSAILCEPELSPRNENGPGCSIGMLVLDRISLSTGYIAVTSQKALAIGGGHQLRPALLAENAFTQ